MAICNCLYVCVYVPAAFPVCLEHALCVYMLLVNHSDATQGCAHGTTALYKPC